MSTKTATKSTDYLRVTAGANQTDLTVNVVNSVLSIFQLGRETEKAFEAFAATSIALRRVFTTDIKEGSLKVSETRTLSWKAQEGVADLTGRSQAYKEAMKQVFKTAETEVELLLISEGVKPSAAHQVALVQIEKIKNSMGLPIRRWLNDHLTATQQAAYGLKYHSGLGVTNKLPDLTPATVGKAKTQAETYRAKLVEELGKVNIDDVASLVTLASGIVNRAVGKVLPEHKATREEKAALAALLAGAKALDAKLTPAMQEAPKA